LGAGPGRPPPGAREPGFALDRPGLRHQEKRRIVCAEHVDRNTGHERS
jgi:hypothetical protein